MYEEILMHVVTHAYKNNINLISSEALKKDAELIEELKMIPEYKPAVLDGSFYEKANILLNNFETEMNDVPSNLIEEDTIISEGMVFTPVYLAKIVVQICNTYITEEKINLAGDVSSGMGAFIYALNNIIPEASTLSFEKNSILHKLSSIFFSNDHNRILNMDTLSLESSYDESFDLIVGNPPYVRLQNLDKVTRSKLESDELYKNYLFGSYDLSVAFIIKIINMLKIGGIAGLVLTRKMFSSAYGERICEYIKDNAKILEIIDFGDNQMFRDKTTYTLIIIFQKESSISPYELNYCKIPTQLSVNNSNLMNLITSNREQYSSVVLDSYPWYFSRKDDKEILDKIRQRGKSISDLFSCVQGFRTGDNKAFLFDDAGANTRPYIDGKCIGKGFLKKTQHIIWPYKKREGTYILIEEEKLSKENKKAYEHLIHTKKDKEVIPIHAYSRPQNLYAMDSKKIFVKEMMPSAEFWADRTGDVCFGSGYALIPLQTMNGSELEGWSFILSTEIMEFQYRMISTNLHSGWFRMYKGHIDNIILPNIDFNDNKLLSIIEELSSNITDKLLWERLNIYVAACFGLEFGKVLYIKNYISHFHKFSILEKRTGGISKMIKYKDDIEKTAYPKLSEDDRKLYYPIELTKYNELHVLDEKYRSLVTFQKDKKAPIQRWYKYTQGYSTALVSKLLDELEVKQCELVLDPFCGSGTTLLAAKNKGISSVGCDVSPLSCWISKIKTYNWSRENALRISDALDFLEYGCDYNCQSLQFKSFFEKAFYPEILAQTIHIRNWINNMDLDKIEKDFLKLALVSIQEEISFIRKHGSHYRFLNDDSHVGVNKLNIELIDVTCDVTVVFKEKVNDMLNDIMMIKQLNNATSNIICTNILDFDGDIKADIVITSPPYLNRNNYFSQQKIELSLLELITSTEEYNGLVKKSFCSHVEANLPEKPVCKIDEVNTIIEAVTKRTSNNAKIPHMIAGYFNDIDAFFKKLPTMLHKGATIAFVVANCRWNGVVIPVDHLVCRIAEQYGFLAKKIIVARMKGNSPQQMQKFGKISVRESIVLLTYK